VSQIVGVSRGTTDEVISRYRWLMPEQATEIPYGGEPLDFDFLRRHPRKNPIFDPSDDLIHLSYVGAYTASMEPVVHALFRGLRQASTADRALFSRVRVHFVGTRYGAGGYSDQPILRAAAACGVTGLVDEHPARVSYLDALNLLLQSHGLLAVGSVEPHYTASKIFPYILAAKPVLAIFHEQSSVVGILAETRAGEVITFRDSKTLEQAADEVALGLRRLAELPQGFQPGVRWDAFQSYTTRAMAARLAQVFDRAVGAQSEAVSHAHSP
jgi:hypothetical protein